ncbi:MAG: 1-(5-phosphoribosyl)-5-[(5-phosphoribosylamino)methylideneamino]imidazole-4-carboxamide isomerase [Longicatena sp.]
MIILPAIDIIDGKPVRLYQGDYDKVEIVAKDILTTAKEFQAAGASFIHLVDLDGAKAKKLVNAKVIIEVANSLEIGVECGGGIRSMESISYLLDQGVSRVILGTSAIEDTQLLKDALQKYGDKIAVGIDCKDGYACGNGWLETSKLHYIDFAKELEKLGVKHIIVTDISKDGTLEGPNIEMLEKLSKEVSMNIIASGGIANINDIKALKKLNLYGAISGKAIYSKGLDLKEAIEETK